MTRTRNPQDSRIAARRRRAAPVAPGRTGRRRRRGRPRQGGPDAPRPSGHDRPATSSPHRGPRRLPARGGTPTRPSVPSPHRLRSKASGRVARRNDEPRGGSDEQETSRRHGCGDGGACGVGGRDRQCGTSEQPGLNPITVHLALDQADMDTLLPMDYSNIDDNIVGARRRLRRPGPIRPRDDRTVPVRRREHRHDRQQQYEPSRATTARKKNDIAIVIRITGTTG